MPFHLDEDLSYRVALIVREQGMDVTTSWELGWNGLPDEEQLTRAGLAGRCLVSRNYADFARLTKEYQRQGWPHAGVLFVPSSLPNEHLSAIAAALAQPMTGSTRTACPRTALIGSGRYRAGRLVWPWTEHEGVRVEQ